MEKEKTVIQLIKDDPWLTPYAPDIATRLKALSAARSEIENEYGSLAQFAAAHRYLGINYDSAKNGWYYREWAPAADALFLTGDFNNWNRTSHPLTRNEKGIWEIFLPDSEYKDSFVSGSWVKVHI